MRPRHIQAVCVPTLSPQLPAVCTTASIRIACPSAFTPGKEFTYAFAGILELGIDVFRLGL